MAYTKELHQKLDKMLECTTRLDENVKNITKDTELIPIMMEKLNKHELTLYGATGKNGLVGNNKILMKAFWGAQAIIVTAGSAVTLFKDQVTNFFKNFFSTGG